MAQVFAQLALPADPGSRVVLITYRCMIVVQATGQSFDVQMKRDGGVIQAQRWYPGDPNNMNVDFACSEIIGGSGIVTYTIELAWGGGAGGQLGTYGDVTFHRFEISAWGRGS